MPSSRKIAGSGATRDVPHREQETRTDGETVMVHACWKDTGSRVSGPYRATSLAYYEYKVEQLGGHAKCQT